MRRDSTEESVHNLKTIGLFVGSDLQKKQVYVPISKRKFSDTCNTSMQTKRSLTNITIVIP